MSKEGNPFDRRKQEISRKSETEGWVAERNLATGFTFKGIFILLIIIAIIVLIKYLI